MDDTPIPGRQAFRQSQAAAQVTAWMTVGEARAAIAAAGHRALPVVGHDGLLGLITVEALSGHGVDDHDHPPAADRSILDAMDWHLVAVPPDADERQVLEAYTDAAWQWLRHRRLEGREPSAPITGGAAR